MLFTGGKLFVRSHIQITDLNIFFLYISYDFFKLIFQRLASKRIFYLLIYSIIKKRKEWATKLLLRLASIVLSPQAFLETDATKTLAFCDS
jgi:hypothetical protein